MHATNPISDEKDFPSRLSVKALLILRGISQKEIAYRHGINLSTLSRVITGKRKTGRIRNAISQELGMSVDELWPEES